MTAADLRAARRRGTVALAGREVRRVLALWTQTILPPVVTAAVFLAVFGGALGDRIRPLDGSRYLDFILPGLLVMTVVGQATANAATSLFQAKNEGYIEDVLSSPLQPWQIVAAYAAGSLVRAFTSALAVALVAAPFTANLAHPGLTVLTLAVTGVLFAAVGVIVGIWADTFDQHAFVTSIVVTPLALLGGVFYSARTLDAPWSALTRADPLYYLVDAARGGVTGSSETSAFLSLTVAAVVAAAAVLAAVMLIARGWRLKP